MYEKLSDTFKGIAVKYLTRVDANPEKSNQHEIGGLKKAGISDLLGYPEKNDKLNIPATMVYISDDDDGIISVEDSVTWYDTRFGQSHRSSEYRMYYKSNEVTALIKEGDFFLIALTHDKRLLMLFTPPASQAESQLRLLFGVYDDEVRTQLSGVNFSETSILVPVRLLLEQLGIDINPAKEKDAKYLDQIREKFGLFFPKTKLFSEHARSINFEEGLSILSPDDALISWMDTEEMLFRILEREIVKEKLKHGFGEQGDDVDGFIKFSLSVQNRRKSRVGHAFEHHIEKILLDNNIVFQRGAKTEGKQTPDFLFPSEASYHNMSYDESKLRMLGAKTTCKDRWRQVLAEANKIKRKHLITLQPSISEDQTTEMKDKNLQLIVPQSLHPTFTKSQQEWLFTFSDFVQEIKKIQHTS
ncbi:MAG: restriction endonuclease [Legionella sp.]|nr:MAG: restriction endonuclease [Legionella sp.]PJD97104.1 MAG: restriction endonuclease [Legionella sp.]